MVLKNLPYLDNSSIQRRYDAIEVADIMSEGNVQLLAPRETARRLVDILERSTHNGFPVVDPETKKFLGLVRRDQVAAILECGVFDKKFTGGDASDVTPAWARPESGVDKSPLMRTFLIGFSTPFCMCPNVLLSGSLGWAYHINDDRYDYILEASAPKPAPPTRTIQRAPRYSMISSRNLQLAVFSALPTEFASVDQNKDGLIYVSWLNPDYEDHWVNIGAVMNRGTLCVP
jgi:hypothetical protein